MRKWKKITAGILSACLMGTCVSGKSEGFGHAKLKVQAAASEPAIAVAEKPGEKITWQYDRDTKVLTIGGTGETQCYDVRRKNYKDEVKKIVIGDGVTALGNNSFESFTALEEIQFGNGVKKIGNHAFDGCTSLKSIQLGGNIEQLGVCAFANCEKLTDVSIGTALKAVYWDVFKGCNSLQAIKLDEKNKNILVEGTVLKNANISGNCGGVKEAGTWGENITYTYDYKTKTLTFSGSGEMYSGYPDEGVGVDDEDEYYYNFFSRDPNKKIIKEEMEKVVIGDGITNVGAYAFKDCKALKEVKLGKNVKQIGEGAFGDCSSVKKVNWTDRIEAIGKEAFRGCANLRNLYVGKSMKKIEDFAFYDCKLNQLRVHTKNKYFSKRQNMLLDKKQTKLILGCYASDSVCHIYQGVKKWHRDAVENANVEKFDVSRQNRKYTSKNGLLYSQNGKTLYLCPKGKKETATLSDKTTKINLDAFLACNKLKTIIIGKNVKGIKGECFTNCKNLETIKISKGNKYYVFEHGVLLSKDKKKLISCILLKTDTYTIPKGITSIAKDAFDNCENLKHIVLSDSITEFEPECFNGMYDTAKVESITLGKNYYNKGNVQFLSKASYLKAIYVSEENPYYSSVEGILYNKEQTQLLACPRKAELCKMPNTVTSVAKDVWFGDVKELYVSDGITDMTDFMDRFNECKVLHIGKKVEKLNRPMLMTELDQIMVDPENQNYKSEDSMLYTKDGSRLIWCPEQKKGTVTIATGTSIIGAEAFLECNQVTDIVIPDTVKTIEAQAFGIVTDRSGVDEVVFWVPAGKLEYYKVLLNSETGFTEHMVIKEMK